MLFYSGLFSILLPFPLFHSYLLINIFLEPNQMPSKMILLSGDKKLANGLTIIFPYFLRLYFSLLFILFLFFLSFIYLCRLGRSHQTYEDKLDRKKSNEKRIFGNTDTNLSSHDFTGLGGI